MPLPTCTNSLCRLCSRFLVGSDERAAAPTIQLLLYERGVFQQLDDFGPNDLIEQILRTKRPLSQTGHQFAPVSEPMHL